MSDDQAACPASEQLLGEIETAIVGMQCYDATIAPGERANLEREPENRHDSHAIRVENGLFDQVGCGRPPTAVKSMFPSCLNGSTPMA